MGVKISGSGSVWLVIKLFQISFHVSDFQVLTQREGKYILHVFIVLIVYLYTLGSHEG